MLASTVPWPGASLEDHALVRVGAPMMLGFKAENHPQQTAVRGALDEVDDRGTDREFFATLVERFGAFDLDAAASPLNTKVPERFYTRADDGLSKPWDAERVWCNPPYSRVKGVMDLGTWVAKAWEEWRAGRAREIVMLVPANRCEQSWWQTHVEPYRDQSNSPLHVEFLPGRLRFDQPVGWEKPVKGDRPPFGCVLLIWRTQLLNRSFGPGPRPTYPPESRAT